ncbi:phosphatase PAP2/dual specificity phosphatase family protein [Pseudomonas sp. Marseille-QA0892]
MNPGRQPGTIKRGLCWLILLGPLFFLTYGWANHYTSTRTDIGVVAFEWERHIPLWEWTIIPYWSIDLLYGLSFLCCRTVAEANRHGLRLLTAQALCIAGFLLFPLQFSFERPAASGAFGWLFDLLMSFDQPYNQAPSLHIALLVVIAYRLTCAASRPIRFLWLVWSGLIALSVLTTWQHHFIDVPTGAMSGLLCLWLWPDAPHRPPLARVAGHPRQWTLAPRYGAGALGLTLFAVWVGGSALWVLWPASACALVALAYGWSGPAAFQKNENGRQAFAAAALLLPYMVGAWANSRLWTRRHPAPDNVLDGVYLGRIPTQKAERDRFPAIVDLCPELALASTPPGYRFIPALDLVPLDQTACRQASEAIEALRRRGPVLVCCALGYSRSATAVASWLLLTGRSDSVEDAIAVIQRARPRVVLGPAHRAVLQTLLEPLAPSLSGRSLAHG